MKSLLLALATCAALAGCAPYPYYPYPYPYYPYPASFPSANVPAPVTYPSTEVTGAAQPGGTAPQVIGEPQASGAPQVVPVNPYAVPNTAPYTYMSPYASPYAYPYYANPYYPYSPYYPYYPYYYDASWWNPWWVGVGFGAGVVLCCGHDHHDHMHGGHWGGAGGHWHTGGMAGGWAGGHGRH